MSGRELSKQNITEALATMSKEEKELIDSTISEKLVSEKFLKEFQTNLNSHFLKIDDIPKLALHISKTKPYFFDQSSLWWMWDFEKYCYVIIDKTELENMVESLVESSELLKPYTVAILYTALRRQGRKNFHKLKLPEKTWVQFKDKIVDIKTGKSFEASPEYFITNPIPWSLGDSKETQTIDKIFAEWVGEDNVKLLQQIVAYCCLADYPLHHYFVLVGGGRNGKGVFQKFIVKFLSETNSCASSFESLKSRFGFASLYKKLACMIGEINMKTLDKTDYIKKLTGDDPILYEFKGKDPFTSYNYAKIIINANHLPPTLDRSRGFYSRPVIVDFPKEFSEGTDVIARIPEHEYNNFARKCIDLLQGILEDKTFHNIGTIEDRQKKYEELSNPILKFVKESYFEDINGSVPLSEITDSYNTYASNHKLMSFESKTIAKLLRDNGFTVSKKTIKTVTATYVSGLSNSKIPIIPKIPHSILSHNNIGAKVTPGYLEHLGNSEHEDEFSETMDMRDLK